MSDDLVKQLRRNFTDKVSISAADRIEKLEAALREIRNISPFTTTEGSVEMMELVDCVLKANDIARKALEGKDD